MDDPMGRILKVLASDTTKLAFVAWKADFACSKRRAHPGIITLYQFGIAGNFLENL
jgi:hypothetical protein